MSWLVDKPVIVPFDFSEHSELALKRALSLVEKPEQLHVLHVLPFLIPTEPGVVWATIDDAHRIQHALETLKEAVDKLGISGPELEVRLGDPGQIACDRAEELGAELIVVGSHGRTGLTRMLLGSVAERVVRLGPLPGVGGQSLKAISMNRTLLALWAIIFGFILAIVALVVVSTYQREAQARLDLAGLLRRELDGHNRQVRERFEEYDRRLQQAFEEFDPQNSSAVLALERHPLCSMLIIVSADGLKGMLQHPEPDQLSMFDRSLLEDAVNWIRDSNFAVRSSTSNSNTQVTQLPPASFDSSQSAQSQLPEIQNTGRSSIQWNKRSAVNSIATSDAQSQDATATRTAVAAANSANLQVIQNGLSTGEAQWTTWYHGRGLVLGYWVKSLHNTVTMVIVPRGRWLADIVAALPDNSEANAKSLTQLVDVEGTVITQWGNLELCGSEVIDSELPVEDPLDGWRLRMILTPEARASALGLDNRLWRGLVAGGFSLALVLLGGLITVNIQRQLRIAQQQVSFVNQVSHELRTPLTNIRMYTELAMQGLELHREHGIDGELDRLTVIQQETTRLGRLIENVLSFARSGKPRPLRTSLVENAEDLIDSVLETFAPQLSECGLVVERTSGEVHPLHLDREAVEQILVNLISNAIKYGASGALLRIETAYSPNQFKVKVTDAGPGIPKRLRSRIFEPFVRASNRLEAPAGTGIGLTIARQLAREHGGDCRLLATANGCSFEVTVQSAE